MSEESASFYRYHVFFCTNERSGGRSCCAQLNADALCNHAKMRVKSLGLSGHGGVRINKAGCLDRCDKGPVLVVYPEDVWYTFIDESDIDEIIEEHLTHGRVVERLQIK